MQPDHSVPPTRWRVAPTLPVLKLGGAIALVLAGLWLADGDPVRPGLALLVAAGLVVWGVRDLVAPVRLAADADGITVVTGFASRRRLSWAEIDRIEIDTRPRLGLRTNTLEIDAGEALYLLGRYDLDAAPDEVAATLRAARARAVG
ncbi:PH domain-containing protein [Micromonospora sp. NPDC049559]|uniref:PH domain-containing protein n=1 Tax=Micromonospora sp. NPDC049559 TaxID=3155923 RepID=UPI00341C6A0C